jgi:hypothetical protein
MANKEVIGVFEDVPPALLDPPVILRTEVVNGEPVAIMGADWSHTGLSVNALRALQTEMTAAAASAITHHAKGGILIRLATAGGVETIALDASRTVGAREQEFLPIAAAENHPAVCVMGSRPRAEVARWLWRIGVRRIIRPQSGNLGTAQEHNAVEADWETRGGTIRALLPNE